MAHRRHFPTVLIAFCILFLYSCSLEEDTFTITVRNGSDMDLTVTLDGVVQGIVSPGEELAIRDVEVGTHLLQAEAEGYALVERNVDLEQDFVWTVY